MKNLILSLFAIISFTVFAAPAAKPAACTRCKDIQSLEGEFLALKYEVREDRAKGRAMMVRVFALLEKFHTNKRKEAATDEFKALIRLVSAALPYDTETESAESLASLVYDSKALKSTYESELAAVKNNCRQQLMRVTVEERVCNIEIEMRGQTEQRSQSCVHSPAFSYNDCVGLKSAD
jgi:Tfp pilus assembly protein PilE